MPDYALYYDQPAFVRTPRGVRVNVQKRTYYFSAENDEAAIKQAEERLNDATYRGRGARFPVELEVDGRIYRRKGLRLVREEEIKKYK